MQSVKKNELKENQIVNSEQCYVCKRTEEEIRELLIPNIEQTTKRYDSEIIQMKSTLKRLGMGLKSHLDEILKATENVTLDFQIDKYSKNIDHFRTTTPKLDELITIQKNMNNGHTTEKNLSVTRKFISEISLQIDNDTIDKKYEYRRFYVENILNYMKGQNEFDWKEMEIKIILKQGLSQKEVEIDTHEIYRIFDTLDKLIEERDVHASSLDQQLKSVKELRHRKIFRNVNLSKGFFTKIGNEVCIDELSNSGIHSMDSKNIIKIPFSLDVCAICYSLVLHKVNGELKTTKNILDEEKGYGFSSSQEKEMDNMITDTLKKSEIEIVYAKKPIDKLQSV